ncbi:lysozyme [Streptomyces sp. NPDC051051]|uniref:lysozyme n=1 Tax=Streptomyces sp. NPDC051051 TaxID=3155666 RepID=UPI0034189AC6
MRRPMRAAFGRLRLYATGLPVVLSVLLSAHQPISPPAPGGESPGAPARGTARMGMGVVLHDGRSGSPDTRAAAQPEGVDVSSHQREVAWATLWASGVTWAYVKATEGTSYTNPYYAQQYSGSRAVGMLRGAYHFATPDTSGGAAQADYFVDHGGGWTPDGTTLPGVLDIEWNPYGDACFGKTRASMVSWIASFLARYKARTGRDAVIYTATSWWTQCTGNHAGFGATNPLWIARYAATPGTLPAGWAYHTFWQYTSTGPTVGDHDRFNGTPDGLRKLAAG